MVDKKISMDIDDVLELDYLVEVITNSSSVSVSSGDSSDVSYVSRNTGVLNPSSTGTYELEINGQIIEVNVADIPDSGVYLDDYADNKLASRDGYATTNPESDLETNVQSAFSDPSRPEWSIESGSPVAQNKRLELPGSEDDQLTATSPMSEGTWDFDFTFQNTSNVDLRMFVHTTQSSGDSVPYLNGNGYELIIGDNGNYSLLRQDSGSGSYVIDGSWSVDTQTHTARVEAFLDNNNDRNWEIYLDGSQVGSTVVDNNYDTPQLWIINRGSNGAYIDNYRVY